MTGHAQCYTTVVDGEPVTYRATEPLDAEELVAFAELVRFARKRIEAEWAKLTPAERVEREERATRWREIVDQIRNES